MSTVTTWSQYFNELSDVDKNYYKSKLTLANEKTLPDPYSLPETEWVDLENVEKIPDVDYPVIYTYLIDTPSVYTREAMKVYKSLDAYNFFVSGHVQDVKYHHPKGTSYITLSTEVLQLYPLLSNSRYFSLHGKFD